jgi:hypothetical protein
MSSQTTDARQIAQEERPRWKLVGPGLVVAATGVGAADLVATLVAGSRYGYTLLSAELLYSAQIAVSSGDEAVVDLARSCRTATAPPPVRCFSSVSGRPPCRHWSASGTASA